jgi:hypothetical protein
MKNLSNLIHFYVYFIKFNRQIQSHIYLFIMGYRYLFHPKTIF